MTRPVKLKPQYPPPALRATLRTPRLAGLNIEKRGKQVTVDVVFMVAKHTTATIHVDGTNDWFEFGSRKYELEPMPEFAAYVMQQMPLASATFRKDIFRSLWTAISPAISHDLAVDLQRQARDLIQQVEDERKEQANEHP